jgi:nucleoside phosphorylase
VTLIVTNTIRKHVSNDLRPYTCYLLNCTEVQPLFGTFHAWETHISSGHGSLPKWECILCDPVSRFANKISFTEHSRQQHHEELEGENIDDFMDTCEVLDGPTLKECPICSIHEDAWLRKRVSERQFDMQNSTFIEHIGTCMHDFSLLSLPSRSDEEAEKGRSSAPTGASNLDSRSSLSSLAFSDCEEDRPGFSKTEKSYVDELEPVPLHKLKVEDWRANLEAAATTKVHDISVTNEKSALDRLNLEDYTVGWVCALPIELAAAEEMLDEEHDTPGYNAHDTNIYTCGKIGEHNVVIACLPQGQMGINSAAAVAVQMKSTFTSTRFGLMVGIGGGVPSEEADIRLGDIVVSKPYMVHGGVVQYDFGKATACGIERTGSLNSPPTILLNAVAKVRAQHMRKRGRLSEYISKLASLPYFEREAAGLDTLFKTEYSHEGGATCEKCDQDHIVAREARRQETVVHYGTIASGNQVMRDAAQRDKASAELGGVLCFEMEAAGLMNSFPCLVIRGICDYADSHKNKQWQAYAAGTASAYAKEVLSVIPSSVVKTEKKIIDVMSGKFIRAL